MILLSIRGTALICLALVATGLLIVVGLVIAPEIDERAGFFTDRAVQAVQTYEVDGVPLRRIVNTEFRAARWRAYHQDIFFQSFVECVGTPRNGGPERRMLWYVEERPKWSHGPSLRITIMTGLNREALSLAPDLFDPRAGFGLELWRTGR